MNRLRSISLLLAISLAFYVWMIWGDAPKPTGDWMTMFVIVTQVLAVIYFVLLWQLRKQENDEPQTDLLYLLIGFAILVRILVALGSGQNDYLSTDIYRYIFEGKEILNGYNPFVTVPRDLRGSELANDWIFDGINHKYLPTIYPPLAQLVFVISYLLGGSSFYGFKLLTVLFEIVTLVTLVRLIKEYKLPHWTFAIYALSPLVIIEYCFSSHIDMAAMPFLVGSLIMVHRKKGLSTGILLGLAASVKYFAFFLAPVFLFALPREERARFFISTSLTFALLYMPFVPSAGWDLFGSLWRYLGEWNYNASVFSLVSMATGETSARIMCATLFLFVIGVATLYRRHHANVVNRSLVIFGAYVLLTPMLFPWYIIWLLPLLTIKPNRAFLLFSGMVLLSYHMMIGLYIDSVWREYWYIRVLEYLPLYVILIYQAAGKIKERRTATT